MRRLRKECHGGETSRARLLLDGYLTPPAAAVLAAVTCALDMASDEKATTEKVNDTFQAAPRIKEVEEAPIVDNKARLSPYFTIAAAAFGLVSDGCECFCSLSGAHSQEDTMLVLQFHRPK